MTDLRDPGESAPHAQNGGQRMGENGVLARLEFLEKITDEIKEDIRSIKQDFPNRDKCDDHANRLKSIEEDVMAIRLNAVRVGVIVSIIVVLTTFVASVLTTKAVERMIVREDVKIERHIPGGS